MKFGDIIEGVTMQEQLDEVTGLTTKVIVESKDPEARPRVSIKDERGGRPVAPVQCRTGTCFPWARISSSPRGMLIHQGRRDRQDSAGNHQDQRHHRRSAAGGRAIRGPETERIRHDQRNHGKRVFWKGHQGETKGGRSRPEVGDPKEYLIPKGKHISVQEGDKIRAGESLMDGSSNPHDILCQPGIKELARYLVNEVQEVYRLQGVKINDKHIEVIVQQMLRRVMIKEVRRPRLPGGRSGGVAALRSRRTRKS